jgi:signal peptide peptidase SppA
MNRFPELSQRIFNTPLAISPAKAEIILCGLYGRFGVMEAYREDGSEIHLAAQIANGQVGSEKDYAVEQGIAIIPVTGTLVHKSSYMGALSGVTGYDRVRRDFNAALSDSTVKGIAFDIDSGGGEVSGCFDLVEEIYAARGGGKPMMAILSECAYSAAYAIASACEIVTVPRTGGTGSIGAVMMHVDCSEHLEKEGMRVTMIHYGARKVDGNEASPLSKEARAKMQHMVDETGELFVDTVARNRRMTKKAVRATQAGTFYGKYGVEAGLADGVHSPHEAFAELLELI